MTSSTEQAVEVIYETTITAIGEQVPAFLGAGMLILFADSAPAELHDISVRHLVEVADDGPHPGDTVEIAGAGIEVLAVGHVVADNLLNLGHMDLKADGRHEPKLPGDVCVPEDSLTLPAIGDVLRILRPADHGSATASPEGES
jgi:glucitol/sorbitol PTS system EIIA component